MQFGCAGTVGVGREYGSDLGAVGEALDQCLVERPFEGAAGRLWGDLEEGAGGGGDRELLVAAGVAGVEVGGPVDPDAAALPAGLLPITVTSMSPSRNGRMPQTAAAE